jgi:DUF4097 and DUF4098 domain-containing protein YvlB
MKLKLASLAVILTVSSAAFASDTFDRTLNVSGQSDLYVSTGSGNIRIHPGSDSEIHIVGHVHAGWSAFGDVQKRVQQIVDSPPIVQSGNTIRIGENTSHSLFNNLSVDYEITAPVSVALNLHSGSGDVEVDNLGRYLSASSGSGNVRAHGVHGPADLESGSGDIEMEQAGTGDIKAKTGSGNIRIHSFNGTFYAHTGSGDIEGDGRLTGEGNIQTGSGNARLHLASDSHFNLEASTGSGDIRVHFPNTNIDNDSHHHVTASINGGGPALQMRTGSGDIEVDAGGH